MTAVEKVDWFCPKCNSYVSSESVTFEETHQICNTGVILEPLNQNKMTAVEWLVNELKCMKSECENQTIKIEIKAKLLNQALEMEKEQITNAYIECWENDGGNGFHKVDEAEQYYNETFKSE